MATILIKNVSEELLKELKKLKVEMDCRTWADLLAKLIQFKRTILLTEDDLERMRRGVQSFLNLRSTISKRWKGRPTALDEVRRSRRHEKA